MKKMFKCLAITLVIFGSSIVLAPENIKAQSNSFGGVCCDFSGSFCLHPLGIPFDGAVWVPNVSVCPDPVIT